MASNPRQTICSLDIYFHSLPPPGLPSGIMLASSAGGPQFNPQSRTASYQDVIKMVPVVPLFSTEHSKGKILAISQELRTENKCNG